MRLNVEGEERIRKETDDLTVVLFHSHRRNLFTSGEGCGGIRPIGDIRRAYEEINNWLARVLQH